MIICYLNVLPKLLDSIHCIVRYSVVFVNQCYTACWDYQLFNCSRTALKTKLFIGSTVDPCRSTGVYCRSDEKFGLGFCGRDICMSMLCAIPMFGANCHRHMYPLYMIRISYKKCTFIFMEVIPSHDSLIVVSRIYAASLYFE